MTSWTFPEQPLAGHDSRKQGAKFLSLIKALGYGLGGAAISILAPIIVASGTLESYYILIFGSMAVTLVFSILGALGVKERVTPKGTDDERYSLRELFQFLRFKPVWTHFLTILLSTVGTSLAVAPAPFSTLIL